MRVYLQVGYRSNIKTEGKHYPAGIHDLDDELAQYLIDTGQAQAMGGTSVKIVPDAPREVHVTEGANALMESFDLTIDDFPDVERIDKPMVDAYLAEFMADDSEE